MNKDFIVKFNFITNIFLLFILVVGGLTYADTNGIWTYASDITGGTFGSDQQPVSNYSFINPVYFYNSVIGYSNTSLNSGLQVNGITGISTNSVGSAIKGIAYNGAYSGYFENGTFVVNQYGGKNLSYKQGILNISGGSVYINNTKAAVQPPVCDGSKQVLQWNGTDWLCYTY